MNKGLILGIILGVFSFSNAYAQDKIDNLRMELAQESQELRNLVSSFSDKLESVKEPFRNEINKAESQVAMKGKEIKELNSQIKKMNAKLAEKDQLLEKMTDTLARCEASLSSVRTELSMTNKNLKTLSAEKTAIADKESKARLSVEQLKKEKELLLADKQNELERQANLADAEKSQLSAQIKKLSRELAIFQEKINEHLAVRVSLKKDLELANTRFDEANRQIAVLESDIKKADKASATLHTTVSKLEETVAANELQIKDSKMQNASLIEQISVKDSALAKNAKLINQLEKSIKVLNAKIDEKDKALNLKEKEKDELVAYFKGELDNRKKQIIQLLKQTK